MPSSAAIWPTIGELSPESRSVFQPRPRQASSSAGASSRSRRIIIENLVWASLYNGLILPFAAIGWVTPLWAALGMSASSLLVVLNALRLTRLPKALG
ncbi:hypothetical protein OMR07_05650 [Methylobacterium organophilum]|nr:hypothetical protein [Methylobacterium organophilum]